MIKIAQTFQSQFSETSEDEITDTEAMQAATNWMAFVKFAMSKD